MKYFKAFILGILLIPTQLVFLQKTHCQSFEKSAVADTLDVLHYSIFLTDINFATQSIQGVSIARLCPKIALSNFTLELKALVVDSVYVDGVKQTGFWQENDFLHIQTGQNYLPEDTVEIQTWYGGQPFHEDWGGFHFSANYAFNLGVGFESDPHNLGKAWFPCVDDFQDRATYSVSVKLPEEMTAICGGLLDSVTDEGNGNKIWHWNYIHAIPTYLASVVVGDYALNSDTFHGQQADVPITIYTKPADSAKVAVSFQHLKQILQNFENRFGPYPFERVGYTGTSIGAMEHVSNIAYPNHTITPNLTYEYLQAHELSHMWFGNMVTCASAGDMWLNEGWGTFCQYFFKYDLYNPEIYRLEMNENHYDILKEAHLTDGSYLALVNVPTEYTYGTTVYDKGATVVHTIMNYLGQDVFFPAVRAYLEQFAYNDASTYDLRDFLSNYTGVNMNGFFENWIETQGTPHYSIDSMHITPNGNQFNVELSLRQKHKGVAFTGTGNIFEVTFYGANWQSFTDTVHLDGATGNSTKTIDFEPVVVFCDVNDKTLDATTDKTVVLKETGELVFPQHSFKLFVDAIQDSALLRVTHHWAAPDSLKTALDGLRLSPYRHWEIRGILPEGLAMRGRFFYSNGPTLDNTLILSEQDSVVLLYRPNPAADWQEIPQTHEGLWSIGYIYVNDLQLGQYTLAVWDKTITGITEKPTNVEKGSLIVFPNPAKDELNIGITDFQNISLQISDTSGRVIIVFKPTEEISKIDVSNWKKGVYTLILLTDDGTVLSQKTIILQ
ncbi:MAG: M1 family aminopeptidase [Bacteroidales bacterium]